MNSTDAMCVPRKYSPNFKLTTVARSLGIDVEEADAHDAVYDVHLTRQIFRLLVDRVRAGVK